MKPLILEFKESPTDGSIDSSLIEYDYNLNLTVIKSSKKPAIEAISMVTETFTKANGEESDSDRDETGLMMETFTGTFNKTEESDSDRDRNGLKMMLDTVTATRSVLENSDSDR